MKLRLPTTFLLLSFVLLNTASLKSFADVWPTENQWSAEMENKFSNWVETSWDDEIFVRSDSELSGLATDCADATYTMRAYFAYLNHLPFKIINPNKPGTFFSNQTKAYDKYLSPRDRFIAFLTPILEIVDSGSLANDTYPIEISRQYLRGGAVYVAPNEHSYQIKKVNANGIPTLYSSTVPKEVRYLQILESFPYYLPMDYTKHKDGFRAFKQPQQYGVDESTLPGYSLQQYEISKTAKESILDFGDEVAKLLSSQNETLEQKTERAVLNICHAAQDRAFAVRATIRQLDFQGHSCMSPVEYENNSTPGRDRRFKMMFEYAQRLFADPEISSVNTYYAYVLNSIFEDNYRDANVTEWCPISYYTGPTEDVITLHSIWKSFLTNSLISDPNANVRQRWGFEPYAPVCKQY